MLTTSTVILRKAEILFSFWASAVVAEGSTSLCFIKSVVKLQKGLSVQLVVLKMLLQETCWEDKISSCSSQAEREFSQWSKGFLSLSSSECIIIAALGRVISSQVTVRNYPRRLRRAIYQISD